MENKESDRTILSILMSIVLLLGGLVMLISGMGYMENPDVSQFVAALDVIGGLFQIVGGVCCVFGGRPILWKVTFASVVVEIIAGIGMMTLTLIGGVLLVLLGALMMFWLHTSSLRGFFKV